MGLMNENGKSFVDHLIANTMKQFELDSDGNIGYDAYCRFMQSNPRLLAVYSLDIEKLLDYECEQRRMHRISINSLKNKGLRQIVVELDSSKKKKSKWKKPQFIKDLEKDKVQSVHSVLDAQQICVDLDEVSEASELSSNPSSEIVDDEDNNEKEEEEKKKQERMQRTIDFLYG